MNIDKDDVEWLITIIVTLYGIYKQDRQKPAQEKEPRKRKRRKRK